MNTYATFVQELKKRALQWAMGTTAVTGHVQAENDAVHLVGDGMALVSVEEATRNPEQAALRFAQNRPILPQYDKEAQWALCPLTKHQAFLHLIDVGATVRDALQNQGQGDQIRRDAARIVEPAAFENPPDALPYQRNAPDPLSAAIDFLFEWPDLDGPSDAAWLGKAYERSQTKDPATPLN